jgi:hypothetical protein
MVPLGMGRIGRVEELLAALVMTRHHAPDMESMIEACQDAFRHGAPNRHDAGRERGSLALLFLSHRGGDIN